MNVDTEEFVRLTDDVVRLMGDVKGIITRGESLAPRLDVIDGGKRHSAATTRRRRSHLKLVR